MEAERKSHEEGLKKQHDEHREAQKKSLREAREKAAQEFQGFKQEQNEIVKELQTKLSELETKSNKAIKN